MSDMIDLTNANLASDNLGEMWDDFAVRCTPEAAIQLQDAYNLITLSLECVPGGNNGFLDTNITTVLIDEGYDTPDTIQAVRKILIYALVDCLQAMGIMIDMDYIGPDELVILTKILDTIYTVDGIEDILGLSDVLEDEGIDPKERFIQVMALVDPLMDQEKLPYVIKDVSVDVTKGMLIGLNILSTDDDQYMEPFFKKRLVANKAFLKGTIGERHIVDGGGVQQQLDIYMNLFAAEVGEMMLNNPVEYIKNMISIMLLTPMTGAEIEGAVMSLINDVSETTEIMYRAQAVLKEVNLCQ
ncbi:hypothetical protein PQC07_gp204 [Aeromonas phage D3]|uniref:Uncharacterized protein n=2 Tax=Ludhianavirus TaxID=3044751 RepID=A0A514A1D9_9CAUD|nr:hypothetical protein PQC06_gp002 [Aeromonas phage LAh10]YP_010668552.1 hypothetical protein PQC07_gp204 [Aeromonas phage D3]QDH47093.1 hypothetical protein LAh10_2 [Aeromonas phage LAh10]QDJ97068.1 hypothetical protein D3_0071 [Aeromonas phage D3]QEP52374.1 hypothetical protein D9_0167 [Aeromonas phage D9]